MVDRFMQPYRFQYVKDFCGFGVTRGINRYGAQRQEISGGLLNGYVIDVAALDCTVGEWWKLMRYFARHVTHASSNILQARQNEFEGDLWLGADHYLRVLGENV